MSYENAVPKPLKFLVSDGKLIDDEGNVIAESETLKDLYVKWAPEVKKYLLSDGSVVDENNNLIIKNDYYKQMYEQADPKIAKYLHADGTVDENSGSGGNDLENNHQATIDVSTYTEPVEIEPVSGKDGMKKATITLSNIPGGTNVLHWYKWKETNESTGESYEAYLTLEFAPTVDEGEIPQSYYAYVVHNDTENHDAFILVRDAFFNDTNYSDYVKVNDSKFTMNTATGTSYICERLDGTYDMNCDILYCYSASGGGNYYLSTPSIPNDVDVYNTYVGFINIVSSRIFSNDLMPESFTRISDSQFIVEELTYTRNPSGDWFITK